MCYERFCRCVNFSVLNLQGMNASQVSTWQQDGVDLTADLAIDGDTRATVKFFTCSHTRKCKTFCHKLFGTNYETDDNTKIKHSLFNGKRHCMVT